MFGLGIYTIEEASALIPGVDGARLRRWLQGYVRAGVEYPPLWESDYFEDTEGEVLSFQDLMEARVIAAFNNCGVRIPAVRQALIVARDKFEVEKPFSRQYFQTDGRQIFAKIFKSQQLSNETSDIQLMEIASSQLAFRAVIGPTFKTIDFEDNVAVRWWPLGKARKIVVDPSRSMGKPIDSVSGVPAASLVQALDGHYGERTAQQYQRVAKLYEVDLSAVKMAEQLHQKIAA